MIHRSRIPHRATWKSAAVFLVLLSNPAPAAAQEPRQWEVAHRVPACGVFAGATVLAADILVEDLVGFLFGMGLSLVAGEASRHCLFGSDPPPLTVAGHVCDGFMTWMPLVGSAVYSRAGGDLDQEAPLAITMASFGALGGIVKQKSCPRLGGPSPPRSIMESRGTPFP